MSKQTQQLFEQVKAGGPPQGLFGAVKEAIQTVAPGLSLSAILSDVGAEFGRLGVQGQMEMASALFAGSAFVPYGPGQYTQEQSGHGPHGPSAEAGLPPREADGHEM